MSSTPVLPSTQPASGTRPAWVGLRWFALVFAGLYALLCLWRLGWTVHENSLLTTVNDRHPGSMMKNLQSELSPEIIFAAALYATLVPMLLFSVSFALSARLDLLGAWQNPREVTRHWGAYLYLVGLLGTLLLLAVLPGQGYNPYPNPFPRPDTDGGIVAAGHHVELSMGLHALCAVLLIAGLIGLRRRMGRGSAG
ncbi:hypothetical protein [Streptacidiphilus rugosus]|uniref:hypothetical protein n=1 Tax=Streptacidiphilus rugosus TaxID=405783 RepID=UPI00056175C9|nr:hypothetical protein [Streptacidiphilus rugosus]